MVHPNAVTPKVDARNPAPLTGGSQSVTTIICSFGGEWDKPLDARSATKWFQSRADLVSRNSDTWHKSRSAAPGWQGATTENIGHI